MFELKIERLIDAPVATVWAAWQQHFADWFVPRPWTLELIELDLRPGGRSAMVMRGPAGEESAVEGVFLEVVPQRRIVWTDALQLGWIPAVPFIVRIDDFADERGQTRYTASARHWTREACDEHAAMGFTTGWGAATDQLEEIVARLK